MFELKYQRKNKLIIKYIMIVAFLIVSFLTGCKNHTKESTVSKKGLEKIDKIPLSQLVDWNQEKIIDSTDLNKPALVLNDSYVFYATADLRIVRVDRRTKEKITIAGLKKRNGQSIKKSDDYGLVEAGLALSRDKLYYLFDNCLYQCDFDGENLERVFDCTEIDDEKFLPEINKIHIYKNQIYLQLGLLQNVRFDLNHKKIEFMADDVRSNWCFYKNYFYYQEINKYGFKQVDLETLKSKYIRGTEWSEKLEKSDDSVIYGDMISANGNLYYTCYKKSEAKQKLYQYRENGKDIEKLSFDGGVAAYNSSKLVWQRYDEEKEQTTLYLFDFKTEKNQKISEPFDYSEAGFIEDDIILYKRNSDEEKERSGYMYSSYSVLKIH